MDKGHVYSQAGADETTLRSVIRSLRDELKYLAQWRVEDIAFEGISNDGPTVLWPEGRCFGKGAEVRWRKTGGGYDVLVLSETPRELGDGWKTETYEVRSEEPDGEELRIYLWGTWQPAMKAWIEVRIPRPLPYPLRPQSPERRHWAYVTAAEYAKDGMVRFIRWKELKTEEVKDAS
jgi:hypothetical protein